MSSTQVRSRSPRLSATLRPVRLRKRARTSSISISTSRSSPTSRSRSRAEACPSPTGTCPGHTWVFGREREPVAVVNERTWLEFSPRHGRAASSVLTAPTSASFRGFVATHTPCFSLLYRGLGGTNARDLLLPATSGRSPTMRERWAWLDSASRPGHRRRLAGFGGEQSSRRRLRRELHRPTSRLHSKRLFVCRAVLQRSQTRRGRVRPHRVPCHDCLRCAPAGEHSAPLCSRAAFHWSQLYDHRAIVFIPCNVSIMSLFEHYSACAPIYIPEQRPFSSSSRLPTQTMCSSHSPSPK